MFVCLFVCLGVCFCRCLVELNWSPNLFVLVKVTLVRRSSSNCAPTSTASIWCPFIVVWGGAELSLGAMHAAVTTELQHMHQRGKCLDIKCPAPPTFLLACDIDTSCQTVLKQHEHLPAYIVNSILEIDHGRCLQQVRAFGGKS